MKFSITLGAILAAAFGCDAGAIDSRQEPMQANINAYDDDACGTVPLKSLILLSDSYNKCGSYPWDFQSVMPQLLNNSCELTFYSEAGCEGTASTIDLFSCGDGGQSYKLTC